MDSVFEIAVSKIAETITNGKLVCAEIDLWMKILLGCGQSELYDEHKFELKAVWNDEWPKDYLIHNPKCYAALQTIMIEIKDQGENRFSNLISAIVEYMKVERIFNNEGYENATKKKRCYNIEEYLKKNSLEDNNIFLENYAHKDFKTFRNNMNLIGFDVSFGSNYEELVIIPFSRVEDRAAHIAVENWLERKYPTVFKSYIEAINTFSDGNVESCLSACRNVITGIFTYKKDEGKKWMSGLKNSCRDMNIGNVEATFIINSPPNKPNDLDPNKRFNYPRFRLIYQLYSYLSDLGAHVNEGDISQSVVYCEQPTTSDALLGLKVTEDVLMWLYKSEMHI